MNIQVLSFLYPYEATEYNWQQVNVTAFGGMKKRKLQRFVLWQGIWKKLNLLRKRNHIIGILSFWCGECALLGSYFGRLYGIRHISWVCGQDARKKNRFVNWIRPRPNELAGISEFVAGEFYKNHRIKPQYIIPNGIDENMFRPLPEKDIDILGVGSFTPLKQYDIFISIVNELKKHLQAIRVVHCGDGEERENIRNLIKHYALENTISLYGETSHDEVLRLMERSKILLHPSGYEGFSTVCLEALYARAKVVSFTQPMNYDIKNWHVVKSQQGMTEKVLELLKGTSQKYERTGGYSIENTAQRMMDLFS